MAKAHSISANRIPELDGVRGVAILSVLYWHYFASQRHPHSPVLVQILGECGRLTWSGVDLFFVLSGFLIGGILVRNRDAPNLLQVFYGRRVLRIFPLYFGWLVAYFAIRYPFADQIDSPWLFSFPLPIWSYLTFTQNFVIAAHRVWGAHWLAPTWSLAIEEQFYLILPALVLLLRPKQLTVLAVVLVIAAPVIRYLLLLQGNEMAAMTLLQARWDSLFLGVAGACVIPSKSPSLFRASHQYLLHGALGSALLVVAAVTAWPRLMNLWVAALMPTFFALLSLALICFAIFSPWRRFLANRWLTGMGTISYGVYLFHEGVFGLLYAFTHGAGLRTGEPTTSSWLDFDVMLLSLAVTIALAILSFRYFESPLINAGKRLQFQPASIEEPEEDARNGRRPVGITPFPLVDLD